MNLRLSQTFFILLSGSTLSSAFTHHTKANTPAFTSSQLFSSSFAPPDAKNTYAVDEPACADAASRMRRVDVPVSTSVSESGTAGISYIHWPAEKKTNTLPLILIHGFDSSCLEFRRIGPELAALGISTYAVDLLGWGFTQLEGVDDFSADAKIEALKSFWSTVGDDAPVCIGGASLGGASAIEFASAPSSPAKAAIMIDAQGFTDGIGPPSLLPPFLARLGVKVLKSEGLRESANQMSYFDKEQFATDDALKVGRIHCLQEGWEDAQLSFIKSGGFYPSKKVKEVSQKTLVLWGRQDGILDGKENVPLFMENLPNAELRWIEDCGHVPHLEQSKTTAATITEFLESEELATPTSSSDFSITGAIAAAGLAGAVATLAGSL